VYRFLLTRRWLGLAALLATLAVVMVGLGNWQLDRYHQKVAINDRIDAAARAAPVPVTNVLVAGRAPAKSQRYTRVTATGRYDTANEIVARGRSVDGQVGFEIVTPLVLADGTALLVDRGWVAAGANAATIPDYPRAPSGDVTVTGAVRLPEHRIGRVERTDGRLQTRRINPAQLAHELPNPVLGGYVSIEQVGLRPVAVEYEGTLQNGGYALQWWAFAALTLVGYVYLARRQARDNRDADSPDRAAERESAPAS
jgi:cytochrome oxidase assembly protein ShyY1